MERIAADSHSSAGPVCIRELNFAITMTADVCPDFTVLGRQQTKCWLHSFTCFYDFFALLLVILIYRIWPDAEEILRNF